MFRKVLVANRGEIAVRIIRGLREMGIASVAVYSDVDRAALHVRMADEAVHIGPAAAQESYLRMDRILEAAVERGAEAVHPGYGFLSENAEFAAACQASGLTFIGPSPQTIARLGSKTAARQLAMDAGVPVVPGTASPVESAEQAAQTASEFGYPVLLKAALGGGGKGMRRIDSEEEFESGFRNAVSEAERAFGSGQVYIEKLIERPRHIEIQIFGDRYGNLVHLGERECSIQRRHQKVIEECPSPLVACYPEMREEMGEAALRLARAAGYCNAGTVEFLVDRHRNFYFLEVNTRLQVEHPVTELVTGIDLVHLQLRVAAGEKLGLSQEEIGWRGSAIEARIYAEDPYNHFFPSPGKVTQLVRPSGPGIRLDSGVYTGWTVPMEYDPLLAKLAVWAGDRPTAIRRMIRALDEYAVDGIKTTLGFYRRVMEEQEFQLGRLHTGFVDDFLARGYDGRRPDPDSELAAGVVAVLHRQKNKTGPEPAANGSRWVLDGRREMLR